MKNKYQIIMPLALPLALVASVVYMVQTRVTNNTNYQNYMRAAQEYAHNGVVTDAVAAYNQAIAIYPTLDAYLAVGDLYMAEEEYRLAERWYEDELLSHFPKEPATYEFGIRAQLSRNNVREAFEVYDTYQDRGLQSEAVEQAIHASWYSFDLVGDFSDVRGFSNSTGAAAVQNENGLWGYVDTNGNRVLPNIYQQAGALGDLAAVVDMDGEAYFVDSSGNKRLTASYFLEQDPDFGQITAFGDIQSGLVMAYNGSEWNYYDQQSHQKKFGGYRGATTITNGVGAVSKDGRTWALISADGQELTGYEFEEVVLDGKDTLCRTNALFAGKDGVYRLLDRSGQPLNESRYQAAEAFNENSLAAVQKDGRWLFVDETGAETDLGDLEQAKSFMCGLAAAKKDGKWGYIDGTGNWIIEPQFEDAGPFTPSGSAFVKTRGGSWQLLLLYRFHH